MSQSQSNINEQTLVADTLRYILNLSVNKLPFKQADITKNCLKGNQKNLKRVLEIAEVELLDIYGYKIIEVDKQKGGAKKYICISSLTAATPKCFSEQQRRINSILYIILSYIYMKGGSVSTSALEDFLKEFEEPDYFTQINTLINETFVKQLYLRKEKVVLEGSNDERIMFSWGERANLEFQKKDILENVAQMFNRPTMCFVKQYIEVFGDETENNA